MRVHISVDALTVLVAGRPLRSDTYFGVTFKWKVPKRLVYCISNMAVGIWLFPLWKRRRSLFNYPGQGRSQFHSY